MVTSRNKKVGRKRARESETPNEFGQRVKLEREKREWSQKYLADLAGIKQPSLSDIESGITQNPIGSTKIALARAFSSDLGESWLRQHIPHQPSAFAGSVEINILGRVAAGKPIEPFPTEETISVPAMMLARGKEAFALQVQGDSMNGVGIFHGDMIILRECPEPTNGQVVVVQVNEEVTLKRWQRKGKKITLSPENPDFDKIELTAGVNEVKCLGEFAGLIRIAG